MRQWMVDPKILCRKHLLGEHVEHHMFAGAIRQGKSMTGYLENNMLEPLSLLHRHAELAEEMERRGYNHASPLEMSNFDKQDPMLLVHIDKEAALQELVRRCPECKARHLEFSNYQKTHDYSFFKTEET